MADKPLQPEQGEPWADFLARLLSEMGPLGHENVMSLSRFELEEIDPQTGERRVSKPWVLVVGDLKNKESLVTVLAEAAERAAQDLLLARLRATLAKASSSQDN